MTVEGQDWAGYQAATPSTSGLAFAFIKATEGHTFTNDRHTAQVAHARAAGLVVGHYHFVRPGSMTAQADYFLKQAGAKAGDVLVLDWEDTNVSCAEKDTWLKYVQEKAPEHRVGLYVNRDFWLHRDSTSFCGSFLWIADPSAPKGKPRIEHPWLFHQYSEAGGVDHNVGNFADRAALAAWAGAAAPKPAALPKVSLKRLIAAAKADPKKKQGGTTHPADVKPVEAALKKLGLLPSKYASDGSFGTLTVTAYGAYQKAYSKKHHLGWTGADVNGIPGLTSLRGLAAETHLFTVVD